MTARSAPNRPNILVISTDQQRFDTLGCYGNPHVHTPNLDHLAAEGIVFTHCFAPNPVCAPSRAAMYTGRWPHVCGVWANGVDIPRHELLFTRLLADAGYHCALIGKLHLGACCNGRVEPRLDDGYEVYEWAHHPGDDWGNANAWWRWLQDQPPAPHPPPPPYPIAMGGVGEPKHRHFTHWAAERTIDLLRSATDRPFFIWMSLFDPHHPFDPPLEYLQMYDPASIPPPRYLPGELDTKPWFHCEGHLKTYRHAPGFVEFTEEEIRGMIAAYWGMVSFIDAEVGRVLAALDDLGLAHNTLVIFTSDHGDMLGDHGLLLKGPFFYEGAIRVPFLMRWPDGLPQGTAVPSLASLVDFAPTILDAAGVDIPRRMQGISLLPAARGEAWSGRCRVLSIYRESETPRTPPVYASMLRTQSHKIVVHHGSRDGELYDLQADPDEFHNLWFDAASADLRREMLHQLIDELVATEDPGGERVGRW